jgi:uncharacterized protein (DUF3084 family)
VQAELLTLDQQIADYEDMICRKDEQIEGMREDLQDAEKKKKSEEETFKQQLLDEANRRNRDQYIPIQGDLVDEMLAQAVNHSPYFVQITRHGDGKYTYGSRTIHA